MLTCRLCKENNSIISKKYGYILFQNNQYQIQECPNCLTLQSYPIPSSLTIENYYKNEFSYSWYVDHLLWKKIDAFIRFKELKQFLGNSCLDFGGGIGYFSQICNRFNIYSITHDPFYFSSELEMSGNTWDSIVLFHSLEHSSDPASMVTKLMTLLNKGGKLIIVVPNRFSNSYRKYEMEAVWAQPPIAHIFHFSSESFSKFNLKEMKLIYQNYSDRWDANYPADVILRDFTNAFSRQWTKFKSPRMRKVIAFFFGFYRYTLYFISS